VSVDNSNKA